MAKKVLILGAGGHSKVLAEILETNEELKIAGFVDNPISNTSDNYLGYPILGTDHDLPKLRERGIEEAIVGVGSVDNKGNKKREYLFKLLLENGFDAINAIHSNTSISKRVGLGKGIMIASGAIANSGVKIDDNVIINTGAIIDHDCEIGHHVHIAPSAALAGEVIVGPRSYIGIGAKVIQDVEIGEDCTVGAGAVVLEDVHSGSTVAGVPAKEMSSNGKNL